MTDPLTIRPVILAGGSGTRLWPVSRASLPKQFVPLLGEETLFQAAVRRAAGFAAPVIVTAEPFRFVVLEQLDAIGVTPAAVLVEPAPRNTAPAVAAALAWAETHDDRAHLLVLPADHAIPDAGLFRATVAEAAGARLTVFGIVPTRPETGYGWIEADRTDAPGPVIAFTEKPDAARAEAWLAGGRHLWNAGIFLGPVAAFARAFEAHAPAILSGARGAVAAAREDLGFLRLDPAHWAGSETISVDRAVIEKAGGLHVVPYSGAWSDLGSWDAVAQISADQGAVTAIDCAGSHLSAGPGVRLLGLGLRDMIAVALPDAVLVAPRDRAQEVGAAVAAMAASGVTQATAHPRDHRPWGWFETIALGDRFRVKRIVVKPGGRLSLQSHRRRAEHWVVVEGTAQVTVSGKKRRLGENQSIYVPVGARHRLENETARDLVLIEVQTGAYLEEDDIERFDDAYARE